MANKTTSLDKLENELSDWLEQRKMDIGVIKNLGDNEILKEYLETFNLAQSIENAKAREEKNKKVEEVMKKAEKSDKKYINIISQSLKDEYIKTEFKKDIEEIFNIFLNIIEEKRYEKILY